MNNILIDDTKIDHKQKIFIYEIAKNHIINNYEKYISNSNKPEYPKINLEDFVNFFVKAYYKNISKTNFNELYIKNLIDIYFEEN